MKLLFAFTLAVVFAVVLAEESTTEPPPAPTKPGEAGECGISNLAPDSTDPKRFFSCVGGKPLKNPQDCAEGTEFDKDLGICNWPK